MGCLCERSNLLESPKIVIEHTFTRSLGVEVEYSYFHRCNYYSWANTLLRSLMSDCKFIPSCFKYNANSNGML